MDAGCSFTSEEEEEEEAIIDPVVGATVVPGKIELVATEKHIIDFGDQ